MRPGYDPQIFAGVIVRRFHRLRRLLLGLFLADTGFGQGVNE